MNDSLNNDDNPVLLQLYLPRSQKLAFKRACFLCDTTMSRELRKMIHAYCNNPPLPDRAYYSELLPPYSNFNERQMDIEDV